jgi:ADP-ribosyl-[dinitrogen reductase] hydrolase
MIRDSKSDPLQIATVPAGSGVIGMKFCPGKVGPSTYGQPWNRDLGADLKAITEWNAAAVVTLMEAHEFELLGVPQLGRAIESAGLEWHHLPIVDVDMPDETFRRRWIYSGHRLRDLLKRGNRVLVHCRGGLGRTGLVAA